MVGSNRKETRVVFQCGLPACMMSIDGTWRRSCMLEDISETGAQLTVEGSIQDLNLKEFFLLLSSTGLAYRHCQLLHGNGEEVGVVSLEKEKKPAANRRDSGPGRCELV